MRPAARHRQNLYLPIIRHSKRNSLQDLKRQAHSRFARSILAKKQYCGLVSEHEFKIFETPKIVDTKPFYHAVSLSPPAAIHHSLKR
jgi:hypothetical protein